MSSLIFRASTVRQRDSAVLTRAIAQTVLVAVLLAHPLYGACLDSRITYDQAEGRVSFELGSDVDLAPLDSTELGEAFPVFVEQGSGRVQIRGDYRQDEAGIVFNPQFEFIPGVGRYRAEIRWDKLEEFGLECSQATPETFIAFAPAFDGPVETTEVLGVYPDAAQIPENILRFYVTFSQPMALGSLSGQVRVESADGADVEAFFLDSAQPLWNGDRTRLTLLLDPGRIKRGVGPNVEIGPAIREGETYRLVIESGIRDSRGNPLSDNFAHSFTVTSPVYEALTIDEVVTSEIEAGTRNPLRISFPHVMDVFQLSRLLAVVTDAGVRVEGAVESGPDPYSVVFVPSVSWGEEAYTLRIASEVEDVAGNTFLAAFDESSSTNRRGSSEAVQVRALTVVGIR